MCFPVRVYSIRELCARHMRHGAKLEMWNYGARAWYTAPYIFQRNAFPKRGTWPRLIGIAAYGARKDWPRKIKRNCRGGRRGRRR